MVRAVRPLRSLSMARGCARIDSRLDTVKISLAGRVEVHHARFLAVIGVRKTFPHGLGPKRTSPRSRDVCGQLIPVRVKCRRPDVVMSRRKINFLKKLVNRSANSPLPLARLRWKLINICACHTDPAGQRRFSGKAPRLYEDKAAHLSR